MFSYTKQVLLMSSLALSISHTTLAQNNTLANQETTLLNLYNKMMRHNDSTDYYAEAFEKAFLLLLKSDNKTLQYSFAKLTQNNKMQIKKSADGKLKIYTWDDQSGGTMRFFKTIYQYKNGSGINVEIENLEEGDAGNFIVKIHQIVINKVTHYLPIFSGTYSNKDMNQTVCAFTIKEDKLIKQKPLFKSKTQLLTKISVNYDFFSVMDHKERPIELIRYNDAQKKLLIPVVNDEGKVSKKNLIYELKGDYLQYVGIQ
jgi:hypothetical protein